MNEISNMYLSDQAGYVYVKWNIYLHIIFFLPHSFLDFVRLIILLLCTSICRLLHMKSDCIQV